MALISDNHCAARNGMAGQGKAGRGKARQGSAGRGKSSQTRMLWAVNKSNILTNANQGTPMSKKTTKTNTKENTESTEQSAVTFFNFKDKTPDGKNGGVVQTCQFNERIYAICEGILYSQCEVSNVILVAATSGCRLFAVEGVVFLHVGDMLKIIDPENTEGFKEKLTAIATLFGATL